MNETVDDIVAEMRKLGELDEKSTDKIPRSLMGLGLRTYADRLEAEAEPVGNAAAMREVLKPWIAFAEWLLENAGKDKLGEAIRENGPIIRQRMEELRAALSAPPRNCDLARDWLQDLYCKFKPPATVRREMPPEWVDAVMAFCKWLLAPAAQEGGAE